MREGVASGGGNLSILGDTAVPTTYPPCKTFVDLPWQLSNNRVYSTIVAVAICGHRKHLPAIDGRPSCKMIA